MQRFVLFTFDYELFLGKNSGRVDDCLIAPTDKLLSVFKNAGFKAIFFIDTVYLKKLSETSVNYMDAKKDLASIEGQLKKIASEGHYLFPHIHAHWLDAEYLPEINEWSLTNKRYYRFSNLPQHLQDELFDHSINYLNSVVEENKRTPIDSYRAGGWSIQPFSHFKKQFVSHGIKHDWSVIPGRYQFSDAHEFDFRNAPKDKAVYRFSEDVCTEDRSGQFTEWTISSVEFSGFQKWIDFKISGILQRLYGKQKLKGSTIDLLIKDEGDNFCKEGNQRITASFEGMNSYRIKKYLAAIKNSGYFQFISHPKMLTAYDLKLMEKFIAALKKIKGIETDFRKA